MARIQVCSVFIINKYLQKSVNMNRYFLVIIACAALFFAACQETKEDAKTPLTEKDLYRSIGEEIPFETGMAWIDFHKQRESSKGRLDSLPTCEVTAEKVKAMLSSVDNLVGVAFHYGIDDFGQSHILVIPVNESMELWSLVPNRIMLDANTGLEINQDLAYSWAERFKTSNPSEIWYHFFGKKVFDEMSALPYFERVDIERATNSEEMSPELLLVIWNEGQTSLGRTAAVYGTVYDASNACPPCATI